jgi:putative transposase
MLLEEFSHLRKQFWGGNLWGRGYVAVTPPNTITDKMVKEYIAEREGESLNDDSRFRIGDRSNLPPTRR